MAENLEDLSDEEIFERITPFEEKGFWFLPAWTMDEPITPDRIKLPSGEAYDLTDIDKKINEKKRQRIEFGDRELTMLSEALSFYKLIRALDASPRYNRYTQSFLDDGKDLDSCRRKYSL
ncbi:hypothetical protein J4474_04545 [Candidatus Pacearchaeota archaeon]|nr:hypothetical protein [Candidatus Pacearchaeota archaeon]